MLFPASVMVFGVADANIFESAAIVIAIDVILGGIAYLLIARGWKLKS